MMLILNNRGGDYGDDSNHYDAPKHSKLDR
jgi:hypothetical protein